MAVETLVTSAFSVGNGVTTTFSLPFYFIDPAHIVITLDGVEQTGGYNVTGTRVATGGSVTFDVAPDSDVIVGRNRVVPITQPIDTQNNQTIFEDVFDDGLDRRCMVEQQLEAVIGLSLHYPAGETATSEIPAEALRADRILAFDSDGNAVVSDITLAAIEALAASAATAQIAVGFTTLSALVTAAALFNSSYEGATATLFGYNSVFDGAGGKIRLTQSPTETANNVTCYDLGSGWYAERVVKSPWDIRWCGARGDAVELTGISLDITDGAGFFATAAVDTWVAGDAGKGFALYAAGDTYDSHFTTIASVINARRIQLADAASRSVTAVPAQMGHYAREAIQDAIDAMADAGYAASVGVGTFMLDYEAVGFGPNSPAPTGAFFGQFLFTHGTNVTYSWEGVRVLGAVLIGDARDMTVMPQNVVLNLGGVSPLGDSRDGTVDGGAVAYNSIGITIGTNCTIECPEVKGRTGTRMFSAQTNRYWGLTPDYLNIVDLKANVRLIGDPDYPPNDGVDISSGVAPDVSGSSDGMVNGIVLDAEVYDAARPFYITGDSGANFHHNIHARVVARGSDPIGSTPSFAVQRCKNSTFDLYGTGINGRGVSVKVCDETNFVKAVLFAGASPGDYGSLIEEGTSGDTPCRADFQVWGAWDYGYRATAKGCEVRLDIADATVGVQDVSIPQTYNEVTLRRCGTPYEASLLTTANVLRSDFALVDASEVVTIDQGVTRLRAKLKRGSNSRVGTFVLNGATPVSVANTSFDKTSAVVISLNTVGGTVGALPTIQTVSDGVGFTVAGTIGDTSTYNYALLENKA